MQLWLMKSEPDVYSIDELAAKGTGVWEGVRNYQARNYLRAMKSGDLTLFYHSNAEPSGVVGVARIVKEAYVDPFQFDANSPYFDPKSKREDPRWSAVDVGFVEKFREPLTLAAMKGDDALASMVVVQRGSRLSVTPVERAHFEYILRSVRAKTKLPKDKTAP